MSINITVNGRIRRSAAGFCSGGRATDKGSLSKLSRPQMHEWMTGSDDFSSIQTSISERKPSRKRRTWRSSGFITRTRIMRHDRLRTILSMPGLGFRTSLCPSPGGIRGKSRPGWSTTIDGSSQRNQFLSSRRINSGN